MFREENERMKPLVTIITATYNAASSLQATIASIRQQSYVNIEWIIVDGGSSDDTVRILQQNDDVIQFWTSEPDNGIYDAWNKGIARARGEWIGFLGAGDTYHHDAILKYVSAIEASKTPVQLITSRIRLVDQHGNCKIIVGEKFDWSIFQRRMNIAHVGALHHRSLFDKYGIFDTEYSSAGDYEFLFRTGATLRALFLDAITADMIIGGSSCGYRTLHETYSIQKKYGANRMALLRYFVAFAKRIVRPVIRGY